MGSLKTPLEANTKSVFKQSYQWVFIERVIYLTIQFFSTIVLAKMILPSDYGIIGMIAIFLSLAMTLVDSGMGSSLIKQKHPTDIDYSTLLIFNIITSIIIYFVLFSISDIVAVFFKIPIISKIIRVSSLTIIINSIAIVHYVKLNRSLRFKLQAFITLISLSISSSITILLAYYGWGVWALVSQQLLQTIIQTIAVIIACKHKIILSFSYSSFKRQFKFGSPLMLSGIIVTIYDNIYSSAIGKLFGTIRAGYYYQAKKLQTIPVTMFISLMDKATFPLMSKIEDKTEFRNVSSKLLKQIIFLLLPLMMLLSILSKDIILLLLGKNWLNSAWIFSILCMAGIGFGIEAVTRNIIKSSGKTDLIFKLELIKKTLATIIIVTSLIYGFTLFIWGILLTSILSMLINMLGVAKISSYSFFHQVKDIMPTLILSMVCFSLEIILINLIHINILLKIVLVTISYLSLFLLGAYLLKIQDLKAIVKAYITLLKITKN